ncbi:ribonuclease Oy-like [Leptopilina boulardi]|uniref:ribonuclease Oy-like n=1 Tax=Leptopilina boulardi TaxID=63433 RepID=UPI0021F53834|nr:ribonuclease Oy-like [Leptopilina boulardi]
MHIFWIFCIFLGLFVQSSITFVNDFEFIVFSQQWLKSTCIKLQIPTNKCNVPQQDYWTIHGVWPNRHGKIQPSNCRPDLEFNLHELDNIRDKLEIKWRSALDKMGYDFWKHEWDKHGTCSIRLNSMNTIEKYFYMGLKLNKIYDIQYILERSNIIPGRRYPISKILNALDEKLGVLPQVTCIRGGKDKDQFLEEVRICMDKEFKLISCKEHLKTETNCNRVQFVEYPERFGDY